MSIFYLVQTPFAALGTLQPLQAYLAVNKVPLSLLGGFLGLLHQAFCFRRGTLGKNSSRDLEDAILQVRVVASGPQRLLEHSLYDYRGFKRGDPYRGLVSSLWQQALLLLV